MLGVPFNEREELQMDPMRNASGKLEVILQKWFQSNPSVTREMFKSVLKELGYNDCVEELERML